MFCRNCGEKIPVDSVFCPTCGKNLLELAPSQGVLAERLRSGEDESERENKGAPSPTARLAWDEADASDPRPQPTSTPRRSLGNAALGKLLWVMGRLFSGVGFIIGVAAGMSQGLIWVLFGLALLVAAPHSSWPRSHPQIDDEEASD